MHPGDARQLGFKMKEGAEIGVVRAQVGKSAAEKREKLRLVMIGLGAKLDELDKIRSGLGPPEIFANAAERIFQDDFCERMQVRFPAPRDLNFGFEKQIELSSEGALGASGTAGGSLDAA